MSRIVPVMVREAVEATPRKGWTKARAQRILDRSGGCCAICGVSHKIAVLQLDHIIPLELGGVDDDANMQAICVADHRRKTALDMKAIAKLHRLQKKQGPREPSRHFRKWTPKP